MSDNQQDDDIRAALLGAVTEVEERDPGSTGGMADIAKAEPKKDFNTPAASGADADKTKSADSQAAGGAQSKTPAKGSDGKFLPKDAKTADTKPAIDPKTGALSAPPGTDDKLVVAPGTLPEDVKAEWANLSPGMKAFIAKRETDMSQVAGKAGFEVNQIKKQYEPIDAVLGPRRAALAANYGSVEAALDRLFKISDFISTDPANALVWMAGQTGVDLHSLAQGVQAPAPVAPEMQQMQQTISSLQNRLQQFEGNTQQHQLNSQISELDAFENEKDEQGNLKNPFYVELRDGGHLLPELQMLRSKHPELSFRQHVERAYEATVWKHSDTRQKMLTQQQQTAKAEEEARQRAEAAGRSRKFVAGGPPSPSPAGNSPSDDLRADIAKEFYARTDGSAARL